MDLKLLLLQAPHNLCMSLVNGSSDDSFHQDAFEVLSFLLHHHLLSSSCSASPVLTVSVLMLLGFCLSTRYVFGQGRGVATC